MVARLLWEQDVAGSNPVTPIAKQVSPALTSEPPTQGGFFIDGQIFLRVPCEKASSRELTFARRPEHSLVAPIRRAILISQSIRLRLALLQKLLMALQAHNSDNDKAWPAIRIEKFGRKMAEEVETMLEVPLLVQQWR